MIPTYMMNEEEVNRFGQLGGSYNYWKIEVSNLIKSRLQAGSTILDLGCGEGAWGMFLKDCGYVIDAVDIWPKAIEHAEYTKLYNKCTCVNAKDYIYEHRYNLTIIADMLEHLSVEDAKVVLANAEKNSDSVLVAVPFNSEQEALYGNDAEVHIQTDLTPKVFAERYSGYHVLFQNEKYAYYWKDIEAKDIKICVYAICKNEAKFVENWLTNMSEADYIVVLDTGSTDGTYDLLKKDPRVTLVKKQTIKPWRFDVARNESMKLVPEDADVLVCTDFDELFHTGWANYVREAWRNGKSQNINRLNYNYAWSHDDAGNPTDVFKYDKMHDRTFHWIYPVHEVLVPIDENAEERVIDLSDKVFLEHFRDTTKPRAYYMDLLKLSCEEHPDDCHVRMLLAREYLLAKDYDDALQEYLITVSMPEIDREDRHLVLIETLGRISSLYLIKENYNNAIWYALEMMQNDKTYREPYLLMAEIYNMLGFYEMAIATVEAGLKVATRHYTWVERANTWTYWADDILAFAYSKLGDADKALEHIKVCVSHMPNEPRLLRNYIYMLEQKYNVENKLGGDYNE